MMQVTVSDAGLTIDQARPLDQAVYDHAFATFLETISRLYPDYATASRRLFETMLTVRACSLLAMPRLST